MESAFRTAVIEWLRADSSLGTMLNAIVEDGPSPAPAPTLSLAASASADWSTKSQKGRELRLALELLDRSDTPERTAGIARRIEERIATLAPAQTGYRVVVTQFLRSRSERRAGALRAMLFEYRFLILEIPTE